MVPEQVLSAGEAEPKTDVFALGAILFEVVTLERLNRGQTAQEAMRHAILDPEPRIRASMQQRGVSPALASLCIAATHFEVEARLPSARELGARIDAFLRGNQTRADRQELARRHRLNAQLALADAELSQDDAAQASIRAVRELNKALVLDPQDRGSMASLSKVFSEAGRLLPAEGEAALAERRTEARRNSARAAAVAAAGTLCVQALLLNAQVLAWSALLPIIVLNLLWPLHIALTVKFNWLGKRDYIITAGLAGALCASYAALFGPLVFVPTLVVAFMLPLIVDSRADLQLRWIIVAVGLAAAIGVTGLGALGLFPLPYEFRDGAILIQPTAVAFDPVWVYLLLIVGVVLCVAIPAVLLGRMVDTLNQTERELFARAWMLEEMLAGSDPTTNDAVEPHGEKRADERDG